MKRITLTLVCGLLLVSFSIRNTQAQTPTSAAGTVDSTFTPGGKFNAQFFGDLYYKLHADSLGRGSGQYSGGGAATPNVPKNAWDFQLRRVYLGYNYDISRSVSTEFLLAYEEGNVGTLGASGPTLDAAGERSVYMKLANIQWKNIYSNATLVFGAQATPGYVFTSEAVWGYRSIEKTITDKNGLIKSTDLGLGLRGAFNDGRDFGYDLLLADGTGQKLPNIFGNTGGRDKKLYVDLWGKFLDKKITVQAYYDIQQTQDATPAANFGSNTSTLKFFAAYNTPAFTIGAELFLTTITNAVFTDTTSAVKTRDTLSRKPFGFSVFVTGQIIENSLNFFARFDMFNPDNSYVTSGTQYSSGYNSTNENFIVAGLDWTPYKNVHIMPNIWVTLFSNKLTSTSNITKAAAPDGSLAKSDNDIVPRLTFFYKF